MDDHYKQHPHREPSFSPFRPFGESGQQLGLRSELRIRHTQAERRTPNYLRHGITNLFAALDYKAGTVIGEFHRRHRAIEFRSFLETIDTAVPAKFELHLIRDNYGTHKTPAIKRWLPRHRRRHLHFTPTGTS